MRLETQLIGWLKKIELLKSSFARNAAVLAGGTAAAQLFALILSPIITRIYTPADFGIFSIYASIVSIAAVIATLRYDVAIPITKTSRQAKTIALVSLLFLFLFSFFIFLLLLCGLFIFDGEYFNGNGYLYFIPVGVFLTGFYQILNYISYKEGWFKKVAVSRLGQVFFSGFFQIGFSRLNEFGLIIGQVLGQVFSGIFLFFHALKSGYFLNFNKKYFFWGVKRYKNYPIFSTWSALFSTIALQLPTLVFAYYFGPAIVGIFALTQRVLTLPLWVVGNSVASVVHSRLAEAKKKNNLLVLYKNVYEKLTVMALAPLLFLGIVAPDLFAFIFGEQWRESGEFARLMLPWIYMAFVSSPFQSIFELANKQKDLAIINFFFFFIRVISLFLGVYFSDPGLALGSFSLASALLWIVILFFVNKLFSAESFYFLSVFLKSFLKSIFILLPVLIGIVWGAFYYYGLIISFFLMMLNYKKILKI